MISFDTARAENCYSSACLCWIHLKLDAWGLCAVLVMEKTLLGLVDAFVSAFVVAWKKSSLLARPNIFYWVLRKSEVRHSGNLSSFVPCVAPSSSTWPFLFSLKNLSVSRHRLFVTGCTTHVIITHYKMTVWRSTHLNRIFDTVLILIAACKALTGL